LVEDNEDDVVLTKHAFKNSPVPVEFHIAEDGMEALAFLRNEVPYANARRPDIILLDLNMPRMDGRQLLSELKHDNVLKRIPTIILTTSSAEGDVEYTYNNFANAYMTKPIDLMEFRQRIQRFIGFWLDDVIVLPGPL
jgi:two-component system response regulator